jgi:putative oxidoreductase
MWNSLLHTNLLHTRASVALALVRFPLGLDMFVHGYQKVTHVPAAMRYFDGLGVPHPFAWLAIIAEFCGGLGLMIGMLSRIASFGVGCTMIVAVYLRHLPYGYLMNWHGGLPFGTEGYEYHTLAIGMALAVLIEGAGSFSVDRLLSRLLSRSDSNSSADGTAAHTRERVLSNH